MENVNQAQFWQQRYEEDSIGWDMGQVSPPLKAYIDQLPESAKEQAILVPGAGNAYEVGYLHEQGFTNVTLVDFASAPIEAFAERYPEFPVAHLVCADFFALSPAQYQFDWVLEQTFFCAINPARRDEYVAQYWNRMASWLGCCLIRISDERNRRLVARKLNTSSVLHPISILRLWKQAITRILRGRAVSCLLRCM